VGRAKATAAMVDRRVTKGRKRWKSILTTTLLTNQLIESNQLILLALKGKKNEFDDKEFVFNFLVSFFLSFFLFLLRTSLRNACLNTVTKERYAAATAFLN
jgi:hypothetical protein